MFLTHAKRSGNSEVGNLVQGLQEPRVLQGLQSVEIASQFLEVGKAVKENEPQPERNGLLLFAVDNNISRNSKREFTS
jgi:hypothetical protein